MKVLLIHPPETNPIRFFGSYFYSLPGKKQHPISLLYVATYLHCNLGVNVKVLDFPQGISETRYLDITRQVVSEFKPDVVGISLYTLSIYDSYNLAKSIKSENKKIATVFGGVHTSLYPDEVLSHDFVDAIVVGEGEIPFYELIKNFGTDKIYSIRGLWIKDKSGFVYKNGSSDIIMNLDSLPIPDRSLLYLDSFHSNIFSGGNEAIVIASRGCPYSCRYCQLARRKYRLRSPENIVEEIGRLVDAGYNFISFADDSMNVNIKYTKELCKQIIKNGLRIKWSFRGVAKTLDEETIRLMSEAGCKMMFLGAESGDERILKNLKRVVMPDDIKRVVSLAKKYKIKTSLYFVIGFPGENLEDIKRTFDFCFSLKPDYVQMNIFVPTPGSELYSLALANGFSDWCKEFTLNPQKEFEFPIWETTLSKKQLIDLQRKFYRKFYIRPSFFRELVERIIENLKGGIRFRCFSDFWKITFFAINFFIWLIFGKYPRK